MLHEIQYELIKSLAKDLLTADTKNDHDLVNVTLERTFSMGLMNAVEKMYYHYVLQN